jgi:hypothetical protein
MIIDKHIAERVSNETKRGYWSVNSNSYFFNKYEALRYATSIKNDMIKYHYFDDFYKNLNWAVEPVDSLSELYKRRAQSLRDKYDYLILAFSGGSDSANVLSSFVDNGIHLDEVVTSYPKTLLEKLLPSFDRNNNFHGNSPFEYYEAALPVLKWLSKEHPEIKISDLDITDSALDLIMTGEMIGLAHAGWPPTIPIIGTYTTAYTRVREIADTGKRVCWITGNDKPRLVYIPSKNIFATYWQDISFTHGALSDIALSGFKPQVENFYYNQDVPEITMKQCALLNRALSPKFGNQTENLLKEHKLIQNTTPLGNHIIDVHSNFVKKILYPKWDTTIFQAQKPPNQGQGDGTGYHYYKSNLLDKKVLDYALGQLKDWYESLDKNLLITDAQGRPQEKFYSTDIIPLKFS